MKHGIHANVPVALSQQAPSTACSRTSGGSCPCLGVNRIHVYKSFEGRSTVICDGPSYSLVNPDCVHNTFFRKVRKQLPDYTVLSPKSKYDFGASGSVVG
jgi:hypothetical protein